jgi:crotonobetainyl-CoA:carnitine CoA-transferase CaiB-like acyl-CoA transferase
VSEAPVAGSLEGVTVVGLEQAVAAPFATRQLAERPMPAHSLLSM